MKHLSSLLSTTLCYANYGLMFYKAKLSQKPSALLIVSRPGAKINLGAIKYMVIPLRF